MRFAAVNRKIYIRVANERRKMDYLKLTHLWALFDIENPTPKQIMNAMYDVALYLTIAIALALLIAYVVLTVSKKPLDAFKKVAFWIVCVYSAVLIVAFLTVGLMKDKEDIDYKFYLFIGFLAVLLLTVVVGQILKKKSAAASKYFTMAAFAVVIVYALIVFCSTPNAMEPHSPVAYYITSLVLVLAIAAITVLAGKDEGTATESKNIAYAGVCLALSFALSYVRLFRMPDGGSITFASMLPLMFYSYVFGVRRGVYVGVIYGVMQFIQSPSAYQPMQVLLDYPIAFSAIGLTGIAKKFKFLKGSMVAEIVVGIAIAGIFRYISHVLSGYFVYYNPDSEFGAFGYSLMYNIVVIIDTVIDIAAALIVLSSKAVRKSISEINPKPLEA